MQLRTKRVLAVTVATQKVVGAGSPSQAHQAGSAKLHLGLSHADSKQAHLFKAEQAVLDLLHQLQC